MKKKLPVKLTESLVDLIGFSFFEIIPFLKFSHFCQSFVKKLFKKLPSLFQQLYTLLPFIFVLCRRFPKNSVLYLMLISVNVVNDMKIHGRNKRPNSSQFSIFLQCFLHSFISGSLLYAEQTGFDTRLHSMLFYPPSSDEKSSNTEIRITWPVW